MTGNQTKDNKQVQPSTRAKPTTIKLGGEEVEIAQGTVSISSPGVSPEKAIKGLEQAINNGVFSPSVSPSVAPDEDSDEDESTSK